jgi:hypothetical protein
MAVPSSRSPRTPLAIPVSSARTDRIQLARGGEFDGGTNWREWGGLILAEGLGWNAVE